MDGANGVVIVAIPEKSDYVWRISSEKIPHLTLLYLGEIDDTSVISSYVEHIVNTSMRKFGLRVERRGELGDKSADVLFFSEQSAKKIDEVRGYLLKNDEISRAYNAAEQFPKWTPHLTLGYPDSPAKRDNGDYPSFFGVSFDRIALWTGDYEGPEFEIPEEDEMEMSNRSLDEVLAHYGILGMKWGVRRTPAQLRKARGVRSWERQQVDKIQEKSKTKGTASLTNKELKTASSRIQAELRYEQLIRDTGSLARGQAVARTVLAVGGTASGLYALATSPMAKAGYSAISKAVKR